MKRIKSFFSMIALCLAVVGVLSMTSCKNEQDEPKVPAAKSVAGEYTANMKCSVMGSESEFENVTYTLSAVSDSQVDITISTFGNPPMQVPQFTISGVTVSEANGKYEIAETQFSGTNEAGKAYSGTIGGTVADNKLTANMNLTYGSMPMPMICTFEAPKK